MSDAEDWKQSVTDWRVSGLTAEQFAKERGYPKTRLWAWSSRLLKAERKAAGTDGVQLVEVVRQKPLEGNAPVTIELWDARIQVRRGIDADTLATVLKAVDGLHRTSWAGR